MQRDMYNTVTLNILIPVSSAEAEGEAYADEPIKVRRFVDEDVDRNSSRGKKTWSQVEPFRQTEMLNLVALVRAIQTNDAIAMEKATVNLKSTRGALERAVSKALMKEPGYIESMLATELSHRLREVAFVMWRSDGQTAPALLCPDLATAFLIRVVMSAVGAKAGMRLCPKCGQPFLQKRADQDYCSIKCREAHRIERWRAKKADILDNDSKTVTRTKGKAR
jgi:hypothetical protein